ncbi:MFS transporter [Hyphomicrobium sp.]|jgi:FSR family fosmidomycin resistance protein-like MFS transporter|uniref:MFS transporter n=1 Tax=Hyphomicrobium sp. TaxID=82 RepID=UPI002BE890A8|nr:MFS transporter [Hyphomicrobium sp.]HVZ05360.1 MFS transporter [Hyphomicrobium sp.]
MTAIDSAADARPAAAKVTLSILLAVSFCHLLNDVMQSLLPAIYPMLKEGYGLAFWQVGLLTTAFQGTASLLQPVIGHYTDRRPVAYSTSAGMASTLVGLILLAFAHSYAMLLIGAMLVGVGSAVFHPESSRIARMASGGRHGLAQSVFQVGGNFGTALGPLLAAFFVLPHGQKSIAWFALVALLGIIILWRVSEWGSRARTRRSANDNIARLPFSRQRTAWALTILALLVFSKYIYMASLTSYYTFYTIHKFGVTVQQSQLLLFVFLGSVAAGTVLGGPIGDRFGAKTVIWFSILGVLPFTLALPYANLHWTIALSIVIGLVLSSAFPAIIVFAQELVPGRVGMIAGIFFGFAFGMAGIAAAVLGVVADWKGIDFVYDVCSYLPLLGLLAVFLPSMGRANDVGTQRT